VAAAPLATLVARDLTVSFGPTAVLDGVSLVVAPGDRLGVVGSNGTGKTTLLRACAGLQPLDSGSVVVTPPIATVGYLAQVPTRSAEETVRAALARRTGVAPASAALHAAIAALAEGRPGADDEYSAALDRWLGLGGADLEHRAGEVWAELGLAARLLDQPTASLSGGEAARAQLAAILLSRHDILLLDEPTNDLDFEALDRLEVFVAALESPLLLVSHDRAFLERTITGVVELDERDRRATRFEGGWLAYLDERATARRHAEEAYGDYAATRAELHGRIRRQRSWAETGVRKSKQNPKDPDKAQRKFFENRTEKQASKVRQSEKALDRLDVVDKPWEPWDLRLTITEAPRSGAVVARLSAAVVRRGSFTLGPVDLEVGWADRVAILGPNGSGKSTLLGALLGRLPLDEGTRWTGPGVVVGEIDQARHLLEDDRPVLDAVVRASGYDAVPGGVTEARTLLAKFGLGADHVGRAASSLSPGERTRATLALLQARGVNCLVLDEPTNHLDLPAIEQLEQAVEAFAGTVLVVTHDRRLLEAVTTTRTIQVADGVVTERR
jgi:ATPase subunit of ABC transporter with duplicated ATPase domains